MCYRKLSDHEIQILQQNHCWTKNWSNILVKDGFDAMMLYNVEFYGHVKLGIFDHELSVNSVMKEACIKNSSLNNCIIGDNVYINNVLNLSHYSVGNASILENIGTLHVTDWNCFGNGVEINVLNEGGGRELPIFEELNAQIAYLLVLYQHDETLIFTLRSMIKQLVKAKKTDLGRIGQQTCIQRVRRIENVNVGGFTKILDTDILCNGSIVSCIDDHVEIINARLLKNFIIQEGSRIENGAQIENCFIGQAVTIGKQYSAENSAFFANSQCFHGEACSLLAGPYTVSHHKSSLLIAGMFSFYNAGSGTNQSNHMYKLGPLHQGIMERGCKTGSFSYLLWPSRIGPFSAVMGKHYSHFDVSDFPFSYIEEHDGESELTPAMNLITVGTLRDSQKWSSRDRRKSLLKRDSINFDLFSPYIISKVMTARNRLNDQYEVTNRKIEYISLNGIKIKRLLARTAKKYYNIPINIFLGEQIIKFIKRNKVLKKEDFFATAFIEKLPIHEKWVDILGMIAPKSQIESLIIDIKEGKIDTISSIQKTIADIYTHYDQFAWQWAVSVLEYVLRKPSQDFTPDDMKTITENWKTNQIKLNNMILRDTDKEFDAHAIKGYGIDGDKDIKRKDFENVRGTKETNSFVQGLLEANKKVEERADKLLAFLVDENCKSQNVERISRFA